MALIATARNTRCSSVGACCAEPRRGVWGALAAQPEDEDPADGKPVAKKQDGDVRYVARRQGHLRWRNGAERAQPSEAQGAA